MKRKIIQILSTIISNSYIKGFIEGTIYRGKMKTICVPGLNCYSCPGAIGSCPIGSLQAVLGSRKYSISFYIIGILMLFGTILGRLICGFLCTFGFIQELLYKIKTPKIIVSPKIDRPLRYLKYIMLLLPVIVLPILLTNKFGIAPPYFCQWICPAGTLEGGIPLIIKNEFLRNMLGFLFNWKMFLLLLTIISSIFIYRPFCKYIGPLGAFYGLFNKLGFYRMSIDQTKCNNCKACEKICKMNVPVTKDINHRECIRCEDCKKECPQDAISSGFKQNNHIKALRRS